MIAPIAEFLAWLSARGVSGPTLAAYQAGAERLFGLSNGGPVLPGHVEAEAARAEAAGAAPHGVRNLRKIGAVLMQYQRERAAARRPALAYCGRCRMSHDPRRHPEGCPYCRTPGFVDGMRRLEDEERRAQVRAAMVADVAGRLLQGAAGAVAEAAVDAGLGLDPGPDDPAA